MPFGAYWATSTGIVIVIFLGWNTFKPFDVELFITFSFGIAFVGFMYVLWKVLKRTKAVDRRRLIW